MQEKNQFCRFFHVSNEMQIEIGNNVLISETLTGIILQCYSTIILQFLLTSCGNELLSKFLTPVSKL